MISYAEALSRLLSSAKPIEQIEEIPLLYSTARVVAEDIVSPIAVPGWDNSQMDGYGVAIEEIEIGKRYPISQRIPAGSVGERLQPGTVVRIFTGAPIPAGVTAVIPQELAQTTDQGVVFTRLVRPGEWIRRTGSDIQVGETVLTKGSVLTPGAIGMLASVGRAYVKVYRRLRVGVFFSGDELCQPGRTLPPGGIYNSNRFTLRSLLVSAGCEVFDLGNIPDQLERTKNALRRAAETTDVILSTGGMSVGEEDHLKPAVLSLGKMDLWRVSLKPGKPVAFGSVLDVPFIGIPGNPVAAFVVFMMMVRPFLMRRAGQRHVVLQPMKMRADFDWTRPSDRQEFLRVRRNADGGLRLYPNQNSQVLSSCGWADGLVDCPSSHVIRRGDRVSYYPFCIYLA